MVFRKSGRISQLRHTYHQRYRWDVAEWRSSTANIDNKCDNPTANLCQSKPSAQTCKSLNILSCLNTNVYQDEKCKQMACFQWKDLSEFTFLAQSLAQFAPNILSTIEDKGCVSRRICRRWLWERSCSRVRCWVRWEKGRTCLSSDYCWNKGSSP